MSPLTPIKPAKAKLIPRKAKVNAPTERKSRRKFDFTKEQLIAVSHLRQDDAARALGCAPITLKRNCKRQGYRWLFRKFKAEKRREEAARAKVLNSRTAKKKAPMSPTSVRAPELLLMLSQGNKQLANSSPTSVSGLSSPVSMATPPRAQFPHVDEPVRSGPSPMLPPLTWMLQQRHYRSIPVNTFRPMVHHPVDHKSACYAAAFHPTAPKLPSRMTSLLNQCENERRLANLQPSQFHYVGSN